jgi:hypothetical protein
LKIRTRRNNGFRPVTLKIDFDNIVEYECFRTLIGAYGNDGSMYEFCVPESIRGLFTNYISAITGAKLKNHEVESCLRSTMQKIFNKMPEGRGKDY